MSEDVTPSAAAVIRSHEDDYVQSAEDCNKARQTDFAIDGTSSRTAVVVGAFGTVIVTLSFLLVFWNRFLGLRSGDGGFSGAVGFLTVGLPWRHGYATSPPLFLLRTAALLALFGKKLIVVRVAGIVERLLLSLLVYGWLVRFFRARDVAFAAMVTIVVSTGDIADPLSSYNHFTILLGVATGLVSSYALDVGRNCRALAIFGGFAGILSFLCLASKQTIGLAITLIVPMAVGLSLLRLESVRNAAAYVSGFAFGWAVPAACGLVVLARMGIVKSLLVQTFITGPAAKAANPLDFLLRDIYVIRLTWWAPVIAFLGFFLAWRAVRCSAEGVAPEGTTPNSILRIFGFIFLGIGSIFLARILPWRFHWERVAKPTIYLAFWGTGFLVLFFLFEMFRGNYARLKAQLLLFASVSFAVAFMLSLSFPAFEAMVVPGLALFLVSLLNAYQDWRCWAVCCVGAFLIFSQTEAKSALPFGFDGWDEPPVWRATATSSLPELDGIALPPATAYFVDSTVRIIEENSSPSDSIFIYPELGILNGVTTRQSATLSGSHNIDVVSDAFAREEAQRLLRARPAVLIYGPHSEAYLVANEMLWRKGQSSGQRDLIAAVEELASQYQLVQVFKLYPDSHPVYVFVRPR